INDPPESIHTPLEHLETAYQELRDELSEELRRKVLASSPSFFERLVVDVLISMGYGGSKKEAGKAIGRSGDEGIDGVINEDKLGLDVIYIQAKKWEGSIGRPEIHKFVGALSGAKANKGVFITTSKFSKEAQSYVEKISQKVILIDGDQLMDFMVDNNVGVSLLATYQTKKVDNDYFEG
ncbi:MAG TPA: restriction endonuclease, partial [Bellilinea sp.]|nr:restriction endonuclease [Bellilinea sp.]